MTTPEIHQISPTPETTIFSQLESYPFTSDPEFCSGLATILSSTPLQDPELLTLRARCFYYTRKFNVPIAFDAYRTWRSVQDLSPVSNLVPENPNTLPEAPTTVPETLNTEPQPNGTSTQNDNATPTTPPEQPVAPYPPSFNQIVELITKGEPIPGIKEIPDTLLTGQESAATTAKRKKPWEKDEGEKERQQSTSRD
ncbi:MAG: hypothetical protein Q9220_003028 [cf. Caloplaca sp. 1 TL-2023]